MSADLSIYLAPKSGIVFGDILASSPDGLVAGVTFEPFTSGDTSWRSNARARRPCQSLGVSPICGPGAGQTMTDGRLVGEIWYERPGGAASDPSLLLKLLFTSQPLSIQVHPDDAYAQSMGLACGKTEAWYILSAAPGAKIALGLKERLAPRQLREAVDDGSIVRSCRVADGAAGRCCSRSRRNHPRDRRGSRDCGDPAAERCNVPHVRFRPQA